MTDPTSLVGKVALVTGATSGHGRAVALGLAQRGAEVILLGRDPDRCREVQLAIQRETDRAAEILLCDLASRREINRAAAEFLDTGRPLHLLVNNAGLVNLRRQETADGVEMTFGVNYLAHFQLTLLLLEHMIHSGRAGADGHAARIVNVSSDTHRIVSLDLNDLEARRRYSWMGAYGRSKLAILYFTLELARRMESKGVTVNAVDPGPLESRIGMNHTGLAPVILAVVMKYFFPSAERAARTALHLCASPAMEGKTGGYYKFDTKRRPGIKRGDPSLGARLWEISARMTGVDYPAQ